MFTIYFERNVAEWNGKTYSLSDRLMQMLILVGAYGRENRPIDGRFIGFMMGDGLEYGSYKNSRNARAVVTRIRKQIPGLLMSKYGNRYKLGGYYLSDSLAIRRIRKPQNESEETR